MSTEKLVPKLRFSGFDDNWKNTKLKDITKVVVGYVGTISKYYTDKDNGVPLLSTKNITDNGIDLTEINYVTREFHEKNKKSQIFPNDLLIARHGNSGSAFLIPKTLSEAQALNVVIIRNSNNFDSYFIENYFETTKIKRYMVSLKAGSVQGVVNTKDIEKISINLPSFNEQNKINSFLQLIDKKIDLLEKKHQYYQDFKKYLMQQIFAQKLRFVDCSEYTLKQISEKIENGFSGTQVNYETPFPVTRIETISSGMINYDKVGFVDEIPERYLLKEGDILLTNINSMKWIGNSVYYDGKMILYHGMNLMLLRSKNEINSKYLYYYITYNNIWFKKMACQAVNQASINKSTLEKFIVKIPDIETQNSIANVLTFADEKINGISNQIELTMEFKKGLLQQMFV